MKIGIIGSGIGGLASAVRLAAKGHEVCVYEKNEIPGGKISQLHLGDYRFDTGPSLFTLPELVNELFTICGENMTEKLPAQRVENNCKYFFPDKSVFTFYHDPEKLSREITEKFTDSPAHVFRRLERSKEVYEISAPVFIFSAFHKLSNFNTPPYKKIALKLYKLDFMRTIHGANRHDFSDPRLVQIFDRYATYNGSSPFKAPATLNMIAHLENNIGAFFPEKGMYDIVQQLYNLAVRRNVKFHFNNKVERIVVRDKKATGIKSLNGFEPYDIVISDADVKYVADHLIRKHPLKKRLKRMEPSSSALIFYWAIDRSFPELDLHNIFFSADYKNEFKILFQDKQITEDPTVYLFISSKIVRGDAPKGGENWFVMVNAPSHDGQDWETLIRNTRSHIVDKINRLLSVDIEKHITAEEIASPVTIEKNTLSVNGALYGSSSNSMFSAFLRHPNFFRKIPNLYFVGGSVHPGGGIPLCMASARIVEQEISSRYE